MIEKRPNQVLPPKMVHELLTPEECNELIQFFKEHPHLKGVGDGSDYTGIRFMHIHNQYFRDMIFRVIYHLVGEIRLLSGQVVWPEMISLNEWPIGGVQEPHLDTYSNQEQSAGTETNYPARQWTTILYLNDNYRGGRTYVPDDQVYEPVTGAGLLFQGIYIWHGVEKVRRHPRYTISLWFSEEPSKQMPQFPVDDLNLNEDTIKLI